MNKKLLSIIVSLAITGISVYAQTRGAGNYQGARPGGGANTGEGKVSGKVVDGTSEQPIEYASVAIFRAKDSTLVTGGVTNTTGAFTIDNLPFGKFYAKVTFLGYQKKLVNNILVIPNQKFVNVGAIKLDVNSTKLNEVVVTGTSNQVEYRIDKKVVNISSNLTSAGGTVVDALQNTPSVQTDVEGNVTVRGSSNFTVLIDGKPSVIQGSEALQQIPAALVQNVEIITNPSAKYDAEGSAGIINVVMKKQKVKGFNGSVSLSAGTNRKNNDNFNLNYKYDRWNISLGADYSDMAFRMFNNSHIQNFDSITGKLQQDQQRNSSGEFNRKGEGVKAGVEYAIDNKSTIALSGRYGDRSFNRPSNTYYSEIYPLAGKSDYLYTSSSGGSKNNFYSLNMDYNLNLNEKGQQLSATAYFSSNNDNNPTLLEQDTTDNLFSRPVADNKRYNYNIYENGKEKEYRFKIDYSYQINSKTRFEAGLQSQIENRSADHNVYLDAAPDESQRDGFSFKHNVNAGYVTFSSSIKPFDFQVGLRAEQENRDVYQSRLNQDTIVNKINLFPSVHLSKQLPWDLQLQASYSRRINRPRDWDLIPFSRYMDTKTIRIGNPAILPELTDAFELNLQKKINDMSFISVESFYRRTNDPMQQYLLPPQDNKTVMMTVNEKRDESLGGEMMVNLGLTKWWSLTGSGSLYNRKLTRYEVGDTAKSNTEWNLRGNTVFRLKTGTSIQLNYMYNAASITAQGTRGASYSTSIAIRQELLKRKATLTLQLRDFIGDMKTQTTAITSYTNSYMLMKREAKVITVTFTYRINNYKAEKRPTPEMNNDSGGNDMGGGMM